MNNRVKSIMMGILLIGVLYLLVQYIFSNVLSSRMYRNFGIRIPNGYQVHGIDVSHYQKNINWELVKKMRDQGVKLQFAIIKCTEGTQTKDANYSANIKSAKKFGIKYGAYHYFSANKSGQEQAEFFIKHARIREGNILPVIDIEETKNISNETLQKELKICLDVLENTYNKKPIIYSNVDFYEKHLGKAFDKYPYWAAHYNTNKPRTGRDWDLWQHSDRGNVNGIDGYVDFNVLKGDSSSLEKLCIK